MYGRGGSRWYTRISLWDHSAQHVRLQFSIPKNRYYKADYLLNMMVRNVALNDHMCIPGVEEREDASGVPCCF